MKTGKMDTCAQPYGINTPGMFVKAFTIMLPVMWGKLASFGKGPFVGGAVSDASPEELEAAMYTAWVTSCSANFVGGCIELIGSIVAPMIVRNTPEGAFLVPLAGIGATWLGFNPFLGILVDMQYAKNPLVGFIPFILTWLAFYGTPAGTRPFGPVPIAIVTCTVGVILYLIVDAEGYGNSYTYAASLAGKGG